MSQSDEEWVNYETPLELLPWGRNVYTVAYVDAMLQSRVVAAHTRRVEGHLDEVPVNLGVNKADVALRPFLYVGKALQTRLGVRAGDVVTCTLRPVAPDFVPIPADVAEALFASGRSAAFSLRRPSEQRRLLQPIENALEDETRRRRIQALIRDLPLS